MKLAATWRCRRLLALTGAALVMACAFAPIASADDPWSGVWHTHHKFGEPKLNLDLIQQPGNDLIKGNYYKENGNLLGHIHGERGFDGGTQFWAGTFRDIGASSKGKFSVVLKSDHVSFAGWFKTCGVVVCSERYRWTGEHA